MINKNKFSIKDTKKVLHKVGKKWVVVSAVLLGLVAGGAAVTTANADTTQANISVGTEEPAQNNTEATAKAKAKGWLASHHLPATSSAAKSDATKYASYADVSNLTSVASSANATGKASAYSNLVNLANDVSNASNDMTIGIDSPNTKGTNNLFGVLNSAASDVSALGSNSNPAFNKLSNGINKAKSLANKSYNKPYTYTLPAGTKTISNYTVSLKSSVNAGNVSGVNLDIPAGTKFTLPTFSFGYSSSSVSIPVSLSVPTLINSGIDITSLESSAMSNGSALSAFASNYASKFDTTSLANTVTQQIDSNVDANIDGQLENLTFDGLKNKIDEAAHAKAENDAVTLAEQAAKTKAENDAVTAAEQAAKGKAENDAVTAAEQAAKGKAENDAVTAAKQQASTSHTTYTIAMNTMAIQTADQKFNQKKSTIDAKAVQTADQKFNQKKSTIDAKAVQTADQKFNQKKSTIDAKAVQTADQKFNQKKSTIDALAEGNVKQYIYTNINNINGTINDKIYNSIKNMDVKKQILNAINNKISAVNTTIYKALGKYTVDPFYNKIITPTILPIYLQTEVGPAARTLSTDTSLPNNVRSIASDVANHLNDVNNDISKVSDALDAINNTKDANGLYAYNDLVSNAANLANDFSSSAEPKVYSAYSNMANDVNDLLNNSTLSDISNRHGFAKSYVTSAIANEATSSANSMASTSASMANVLSAASTAITNANTENSTLGSIESSLLGSKSNATISNLSNASANYYNKLNGANTSVSGLDTDDITFAYTVNNSNASNSSNSIAIKGLSGESFNAASLSNLNRQSGYSLVPQQTISFSGSNVTSPVTVTFNSSSATTNNTTGGNTNPSTPTNNNNGNNNNNNASNPSVLPDNFASSVAASLNDNNSASASSNTSTSASASSNNIAPATKKHAANYAKVVKALQLHTNPNFTKRNGVAVVKPGSAFKIEKSVKAHNGALRYEVRYNKKNYFITANKHFVNAYYKAAKHANRSVKNYVHYRYAKVIKALQLHTSTNFTKRNGVKVVRPGAEFHINRIVKNHGLVRYEVRYQGHNYFITANYHYTVNAYVQKYNFRKHGYKAVRVIKPLNEYRKLGFNKRNFIRHFYRGSVLPVKRVVTIASGEMTRLQLTNGRYVSANKDFVEPIR